MTTPTFKKERSVPNNVLHHDDCSPCKSRMPQQPHLSGMSQSPSGHRLCRHCLCDRKFSGQLCLERSLLRVCRCTCKSECETVSTQHCGGLRTLRSQTSLHHTEKRSQKICQRSNLARNGESKKKTTMMSSGNSLSFLYVVLTPALRSRLAIAESPWLLSTPQERARSGTG